MATPKKKETDYRSGSALLKKQLAARSGKSVVLPSKKNVVSAAKQIGGAALMIAGPGKVVKGVQAAAKVAKAGSSARALKAAQGPSLAKGAKKIDASSGAYERAIVKMKAQDNMILGDSKKVAYGKAAKASDAARAKDIAEAKKIIARAKAEKDAKTIAENVKSTTSSKRKLTSYTPNPGRLPNLIKIDSAKGNSVKKTAYRPNRRTSN